MSMIVNGMLSRDALKADAERLAKDDFDPMAVNMAVNEIVALADALHAWRNRLDHNGKLRAPGATSYLHGRHAEVLFNATRSWQFHATADALATYGAHAYEDHYRLTTDERKRASR